MKKIFYLSFLLLTISKFSYSQTNCIDFFPFGDVVSIAEKDNIFWLATSDNGLISFDKQTLTTQYFDTTNSLLDENKIVAICHHNNQLYLSTPNKLFRFDNGQISLVNDTISGLLIENQSNELIVVDVEMVYFLQNDLIIHHKDLNTVFDVRSDCCTENTDLTLDASGNLWISRYAFYEYDIIKFDGINWESYHSLNTATFPIESYTFNGISSFQNNILTTSWGGIHQYNQGTWTNFYDFTSPIINNQDSIIGYLGAIHQDNADYFILGTDYRNLNLPPRLLSYSFIQNEWNFFPIINSFPAIIQHIYSDTTSIYIGTSNGLGIIDKSCFLTNTKSISIEQIDVRVFPNPAINEINIENKSNERIDNIELYNINGQLIKTFQESNSLDLSEINSGYYILSISIKNEKINYKIKIKL